MTQKYDVRWRQKYSLQKISDVILSCMAWKNAMKAEQYY